MLTPVRRACFLRTNVTPWQFPKLLISCKAGKTLWLGCRGRALWEGLSGLQQELCAQHKGWHSCHPQQQKRVTSSLPSGGSLQRGCAFLSSVPEQTCLAPLQVSPSLRAGWCAPKWAVLAGGCLRVSQLRRELFRQHPAAGGIACAVWSGTH